MSPVYTRGEGEGEGEPVGLGRVERGPRAPSPDGGRRVRISDAGVRVGGGVRPSLVQSVR